MIRRMLAVLLLAASTAFPAFANDPASTVRALSEALQAGKSAEALALIDGEGGFAYSLDGPLNSGERFRAWLQSDIVGPGSKFRIESQTVSGETVDAVVIWGRGEMNRPARYVFEVRNDRIVSWRITAR